MKTIDTQAPALQASGPHTLDPAHWDSAHRDYLINYARRKVNDLGTAEDLVQDTFVSAWKARAGFRGDCSERTWLVGMLRNKIIDHYRYNARRPTYTETDLERGRHESSTEREPQGWMEKQATHDNGSDPVKVTERREFLSRLERAIARLPRSMGQAFRMREVQGCSTEEITRSLNISSGNLWVLIHRAKQALRTQLEAEYS
ncbi:MAG: RNA polymerase sigma factor [Verrucomicrobiales bacterium]|nr:sigma-70 family RNA polymerase sigma factor [Verrucomicrobiae bacterium]